MPPHNSLHTVFVTLYSPTLFQSTDMFWKSVCLHWKWKGHRKQVIEMRWQQGLFPVLLSGERRRRYISDGWPAETSRLACRRKTASASILEREVYSAVVCGRCVWVKIRPVAALSERRQDGIWGSWKRPVRKVISRVLQQRPGGRDRAEEWLTAWVKLDQPSRQTQPWHPQNSWL